MLQKFAVYKKNATFVKQNGTDEEENKIHIK